MPSFNELLQDAIIRRSIAIERYKSGLSRDIIKFMNTELEPDLLERLRNKLDGTLTKQRLQETERIVRGVLAEHNGTITNTITAQMGDFAETDANWLVNAFKKSIPIEVAINAPAPEVLKQIVNKNLINGRYFTEYMRDFDNRIKQSVLQQIRLGVAEGQGVEAIVRRIKGTRVNRYTDGILEQSRRNIQALVRTTVAGVMSEARAEVYQSNDGIVNGWRFVATLDLRTTIQCAALDGTIFITGEGTLPPLHFNCRSTHTPVLKSWKELGFKLNELPESTRATMDGQIPSTVKFEDWLKKRTDGEQNEVLGKTKAELFRAGKVNLKDLIDQKYQPLTLEQLKNII
jgi:SPP1 gp7 family putative phage head morphogenesis protein